MNDLTEYERNLAERFRDSLFDIDIGIDEGLLDPSHPEHPAVMALVFQPRTKKIRKPKPHADLKQESFNA